MVSRGPLPRQVAESHPCSARQCPPQNGVPGQQPFMELKQFAAVFPARQWAIRHSEMLLVDDHANRGEQHPLLHLIDANAADVDLANVEPGDLRAPQVGINEFKAGGLDAV
jgi:hypothetical protein